MTLLELLVKELPKRGGWPEETSEFITQDGDGTVRCWVGSVLFMFDNDWCIKAGDHRQIILPKTPNPATDYNTAIITREQYEAALAAAQQLVWNGEGIPPVGVNAEVLFMNDDSPKWYSFVASYIGKENVIAMVGLEELSYTVSRLSSSIVKFRPIRSEADKKRDAVIEFITCAIDSHGVDPLNSAKFIYDAIAAGKIPGVKLED